MTTANEFRLTGKHVLMIFVGAFGIIIAVNMALLFNALGTFPGLEVANSYVASQDFNDRAKAQAALGWEPKITYANGQIDLTITDINGKAVFPETIDVKIGRPTHGREDIVLTLIQDGNGYESFIGLTEGKWRVYLDAQTAAGDVYSKHLEVFVSENE